MHLSPGTRLGRFEIVAPLGAGGMGRVYRAIDTQLRRDVAVKVIADRFQGRADLRDRFRVEAMAVAALNHPNICQVYDAGTSGDIDFIVMELVDGETLMMRIARSRIPLDQALRICRELAAALGAAHRAGIVHRDVKPSNVMLTKGGVKLMDFGLARISAPPPAVGSESTMAPRNASESGSALGTWQYMSPEQIRGEHSDARSDVFAFGAVMFEAIAGRPAFSGRSHVELVSAILDADAPALESSALGVGPAVESIVRTCLQRDPTDRWQSAGELSRALEMVSQPAAPAPSRDWRRASLLAASIAAIAVVAAIAGFRRSADGDRFGGPLKVDVQVGPEYLPTTESAIAFSSDARTIFYGGGPGAPTSTWGIYRRDLASASGVRIMGTDEGHNPTLSPDGKWLAFTRGSIVAKVPVTGGAPTDLAKIDRAGFWGLAWGQDGTIIAGTAQGLWSLPESGGTATMITKAADDGDVSHAWPDVLPGGQAVLFGITPGPSPDSRIVVLDRRTGNHKELLRGVASARYVTTGHLAYVKDDALWTVPFDPGTLTIKGEASQLAHGVIEDVDGAPEFSFSARGDVVFIAGTTEALNTRPAWVTLDGQWEFIDAPPGRYAGPQVSPDGTRISLTVMAGRSDVWTYDIPRQAWSRSTPGRYQIGAWSPDSKEQIFFTPRGLVRRTTDGTGHESMVFPGAAWPYRWSPRGDTVLVHREVENGRELFSLNLETKALQQITSTPGAEANASYSPDGRWILFSSTDTGRLEIYMQSLAPGHERHQVTSNLSVMAVWAPDGKHIYYRSRGSMWAVPVTTVPKVSIGTPQRLFDRLSLPNEQLFGGRFDITPDGKRFVMTTIPTSRFFRMGLILNALQPAR